MNEHATKARLTRFQFRLFILSVIGSYLCDLLLTVGRKAVPKQESNSDFAAFLERTATFVELLHIYQRCNPRVQAAINQMIAMIDDPDSKPEDRERAIGTIAGALLAYGESAPNEARPSQLGRTFAIPMTTQEHILRRQRECGQSLHSLRTKKGWTQQDLAEKSGVGQSAISMIEGGHCRPQLSTLNKLAKALGVTNGDLWPAEDRSSASSPENSNGRSGARNKPSRTASVG